MMDYITAVAVDYSGYAGGRVAEKVESPPAGVLDNAGPGECFFLLAVVTKLWSCKPVS